MESRAILMLEKVPRMWILLWVRSEAEEEGAEEERAEEEEGGSVSARGRRGRRQATSESKEKHREGENYNSRIGQDDPRSTSILNDEPRLSLMTRNTPNRTTQVIAMEGLDVLDLERFDVELLKAEEGDGVVYCEAEGVGTEEVGGAGERGGGGGVLRGLVGVRGEV